MVRVIPYRRRRRRANSSGQRPVNDSLSFGSPSELLSRRRAALRRLNDLLQVIVLDWPDALNLVIRFVEHLLNSQQS